MNCITAIFIIICANFQNGSCCKRYVPDADDEETYPHWDISNEPGLPSDPNRKVTEGYSGMYQKNRDDSCTCGLRNTRVFPGSRVIGGRDASPREYPFQVAFVLADTRGSFCGGTLINNQFVITAAHCFYDLSSPRKFGIVKLSERQVLINAHRLNVPFRDLNWEGGQAYQDPPSVVARNDKRDGVIRRNISNIALHKGFVVGVQKYDPIQINQDIALIKLESPVEFNAATGPWTSCLPDSDEFLPYTNEEALIIGWGKTSETEEISPGVELQKTNAPIKPCESVHPNFAEMSPRDFVCIFAPRRTHNAGQGDSGGPLLLKTRNSPEQFTQIGITSFGPDEPHLESSFTAFTRITEYLPWIYHYIGELEKGGDSSKWCKRR